MEKLDFHEIKKGSGPIPEAANEMPRRVLNSIADLDLKDDNIKREDMMKSLEKGIERKYHGKFNVMSIKHGRMLCTLEFQKGVCKLAKMLEWDSENLIWERTVLNDKVSFQSKNNSKRR